MIEFETETNGLKLFMDKEANVNSTCIYKSLSQVTVTQINGPTKTLKHLLTQCI